MLYDRRLPLAIHGDMVLQQQPTDGDLGFIGIGTALVIGGGALVASLLGGGWLWTKHEEHELEEQYFKWLEIYQGAPYYLPPEEAARYARGELPPEGLEFGLNPPTVAFVVGSLFALYVGSKLVISWLSPGKK